MNSRRPGLSGFRTLLPILLPCLTACAGDAAAPAAAVRDSAGVTIVENLPVDSAAQAWWTVDPAPLADVGRLEGPEEQTLFRVADAVRLSDGGFVVANGGTSELRWYDAGGAWVRTAGGQGGGPGEYQRITDLIPLPGDSVAVVDQSARRVTVVGPTGAMARELTDGGTRITRVRRLADGRWVASTTNQLSVESLETGKTRPDQVYVLTSAEGEVQDTIGGFPGTERFLNMRQANGQIVSVEITTVMPFSRSTTVAVRDEGVYVGTQDAPEVRVYGLDGALRRIVRTGAATVPVTEELVQEFVDRRVAIAPPERQQDVREGLLGLPRGETVPPYGSLTVDRSGNLWVEDYGGLTDTPRWTVYDGEGARVARIALPAEFTPYDIGEDWILGRELDELDVEHVRLYVLQKGS